MKHERVMAMVFHADDELNAAGTLARFIDEGAKVKVLLACVPDLDRRGQEMGQKDWRYAEFLRSMTEIGVTSYELMDVEEQDFVWSQRYVQYFDWRVMDWKPDLIISHRTEDTQQAHSALGRIAGTVARKNRISLWAMEQSIPGGIEPNAEPPNLFVNVTAQHIRKMKAVNWYGSQTETYPQMEEAIAARDQMYGWMLRQEGQTDVFYAEAFRIRKEVWL